MTYYGQVQKDSPLETEEVYQFLQKSLLQTSKSFPLRGPRKHTENKLIYQNLWEGRIDNFQGEELVLFKGGKIYRGNYLGGLVDLRSG